MSQFNRKGYTTIRVRTPHGVTHVATPKGSKLARIAEHKNKQMERARKQRVREYKQQLREAKRRLPLAERSKVKLGGL